MRVQLIQPNYSFAYGFRKRASSITPPLGLCYLASVLEKNGHHVKIIDMEAENLTEKYLLNKIKKFDPEIVGLTCTTATYPIALEISKMVKEINNEIITIMGGPHISASFQQAIQFDYIDFCVIGEGENTIRDLISCIENDEENYKNIKGITFKIKDKIYYTGLREHINNIDDIPFPSRHLLKGKYKASIHRDFGEPMDVMMTSRGCPFNCVYCASNLIFGRKCRKRSIENILNEIKTIIEERNIKNLLFWDDTFTLDNKRVEKLCMELITLRYDLAWICNARPDTVNKKTLFLMKKAGCAMIFYGVESGVPKMLNRMNRNMSLSQIKKAFKISHENKLWTVATLIYGMPWDTNETILQSYKFAESLTPSFLFASILAPHPGTHIYNYALKNNIIKEINWSIPNQFKGQPEAHPTVCLNLSRSDLQEYQKKSYNWFYTNPKYYLRNLKRVRNWKDLHVLFRTFTTWNT